MGEESLLPRMTEDLEYEGSAELVGHVVEGALIRSNSSIS